MDEMALNPWTSWYLISIIDVGKTYNSMWVLAKYLANAMIFGGVILTKVILGVT